MIRIKAVDAQNIWDVCELTYGDGCAAPAPDGRFHCNALSIAETKFDPEMHPNAIYSNNVPIGFFMYKRPEAQAETAVIYRFMLGSKYRDRGLEAKALEHVLKGLKIKGVKKVSLMAGECDEDTKNLCLSFGFHPAGETGKEQLCYELEM